MTMPLAHDMTITKTMPNCMARALFDNLAESPEELAFRRGDILTVLEQNTGGIEGWWLCSLRGRQGICPGNRLRLLAGVYDTGGVSPSPPMTPSPASAPGCAPTTPPAHIIHVRRRSWKFQPSKVVLPQRVGDVYLYEQPQSLCSVSPGSCPSHLQMTQTGQSPFEVYDVPRPPVPINYDTPRNWSRGSPISKDANDWYDVPRNPVSVFHQQQLTPSSSASSLTIDSMSSSNRSSVANMPEYDVPRPRGNIILLNNLQTGSNDSINPGSLPKLPLEWDKALDLLERLQTESTASISKLLGFVRPGWRSHSSLSPEILDVRLAALRLRAAIHDFADFSEGCLGNAANAPDKGLPAKLRPLVKALRDADRLVNEATTKLDAMSWSLEYLSKNDDFNDSNLVPDALDQLMACARTLTEDIRQTTSFIQGNSTLLFKRINQNKSNTGEWVVEYDYVKLESRDSVDKKNSDVRSELPYELKKSFDKVVKEGDDGTLNIKNKPYNLAPDDKQLVTFYAVQIKTYFEYLTNAIDAFLQTVEKNQPPKIFLAHGKFVVLNAHRLVYIGDTVYKNIENEELRNKVLKCSNALSDGLATTVTNAKNAGIQYPSVGAVQSMVDSVADISHFARDLKHCMILGASQP